MLILVLICAGIFFATCTLAFLGLCRSASKEMPVQPNLENNIRLNK